MSSSSLKERWDHLFSGFTPSMNRSVDEVWDQITKSYGAPERKYHNLEHLQEMFEEFDRIEEDISQPDAVALAIFFHDVYYDPTGNRNEEESAALAEEILSDFNFDQRLIKEVKSLILATKTGSFPINSDQQFMVDIDRSILGKSPDKICQLPQSNSTGIFLVSGKSISYRKKALYSFITGKRFHLLNNSI